VRFPPLPRLAEMLREIADTRVGEMGLPAASKIAQTRARRLESGVDRDISAVVEHDTGEVDRFRRCCGAAGPRLGRSLPADGLIAAGCAV